jgi:tetratricopeptide (TPR) repeat protein
MRGRGTTLAVAHALLVVFPLAASAAIPPQPPWPSGDGVLRDRPPGLTPMAPQLRAQLVQSYVAQGRPDPAARELRRLTSMASRDAGVRALLARNAFHLGAARAIATLYVRERRAGDAVRLLEEAARAHPALALPFVDMAQIHERAGDTAAAAAAYRAALQREPDNTLALNNFAFFLSADPAQLDEALRLAEHAYRRAPASAAVADTLGWLLYRKGDLDRAAALLEEALQRLPGNPQVHYHLGMVYAGLGKTAEARRALEEALKAPGLAEAGEARRALRSLP